MSASVTGLAANTTYHFRIWATNAGGTSKGSDETFKTLPNAPTVVTKPASAIKQTTATLNATVNPNGVNVNKCKFEYGRRRTRTDEILRRGRGVHVAAGLGHQPRRRLRDAVTGLTANTTYHFRISATNSGGTGKGSDETFKTLPERPDGRDETGLLDHADHGDAQRDGQPQRRGTSKNANSNTAKRPPTGKTASCASLPGSGTSPVAVSATLTGLTANTTYHFRISATNAGGTSKGSDETFKTLPNAPTVVTKAGLGGHSDHRRR